MPPTRKATDEQLEELLQDMLIASDILKVIEPNYQSKFMGVLLASILLQATELITLQGAKESMGEAKAEANMRIIRTRLAQSVQKLSPKTKALVLQVLQGATAFVESQETTH